MQKVKATSSIRHNGKLYEAGQELQVNEDQAAQLLAAGVIQPIKNVQPKKDTIESVNKNDKQSEKEETEQVAGMEVNKKMTKEKLRGIALAMGLEVPKEALKDEIYDMIEEARGVSDEGEQDAEQNDQDGDEGEQDSDENVQEEGEDQADKKE